MKHLKLHIKDIRYDENGTKKNLEILIDKSVYC